MTDHLTAAPDQTVPAPVPRAGRRVHRGWALMIASGVVAAAANLMLLTGGAPVVEVIAVAADVPPGTPIGQVSTTVQVLGGGDPDGLGLVTPERLGAELAGTATTTRLRSGDLLRRSDLAPAAEHPFAAMSLPVDPARAAGGAIVAGDRVDVIAEVDGDVVVVAEDAEVLDVLQPGGGFGGVGAMALTVAVDDASALRLSAAIRNSEIDVVRAAAGGAG